jgi:hypothetical protein
VPVGCQTTPGDDCNDNDPLEHPNQIWYKDIDNDGYSNGDVIVQCLRPANYKVASELTATSGDCDDNNASINPGAAEVCNDGVDNNCDGNADSFDTDCIYVPTLPGENVVVEPIDATTGTTPVTITFDNVTSVGTTSVTTSDTGDLPPSGFSLGEPPTYYDVTTTASYSGPIEVCINYSGISFVNESNLRLFHLEDSYWVDVTTSLDTVNDIICGVVSSLSLFAIFEDRLPPVITITTPANGASYLLNQSVLANWSVTDEGSGVASSSGTVPSGSAINISTVGSHSFTVSGTDNAGNSASETVIYSVVYSSPNPDFFLPPVENNRVFKLGSTVPVKFQLTDANGAYISTAVAKLVLQKYSGSEPSGDPVEATSTSGADSGNIFRYDSTENQYIYNLNTGSLSTGTWQIRVVLDDGTTKTVFIGLK